MIDDHDYYYYYYCFDHFIIFDRRLPWVYVSFAYLKKNITEYVNNEKTCHLRKVGEDVCLVLKMKGSKSKKQNKRNIPRFWNNNEIVGVFFSLKQK